MFPIAILGILAGIIVRNARLASTLFYDWDEGMYAQIAKEIIHNRSLFTTFNGQLWLDKPPLSHSLIALAFGIFGYSEFWARMVMVLLAVALLVLLYLLAKKFAKFFAPGENAAIAALLPVAALAATSVFLERSTMLNSDLLVAISWVGYFLMWDSFWGKLFFLTVGVWGKSVFGFYPLLIELSYIMFSNVFSQKPIFKRLSTVNFKRVLLLLFVPNIWYIAGLLKYGNAFVYHHFASQVVKRVATPIELHFGNKYFYLNYLWQNLGLLNLLVLLAYLLFVIEFVIRVKKGGYKAVDTRSWIFLFVLFSPLPFLAFLTLMKTKLTWYVIYFLPLILVPLAYLFIRIKPKVLRFLLAIAVLVFFFANFMPQTYLFKTAYTAPERIKFALCLSKTPNEKISFLVDRDERQIRNVLEAAHYDTTSSFYYGGSPSFVYYSQKKVDYFYRQEDWSRQLSRYGLIALDTADLEELQKNGFFDAAGWSVLCHEGKWIGLANRK